MKYTKIAKELMNNTDVYKMVTEAYDNNAELNKVELAKIAKLAEKMFKVVDDLENEEYQPTREVTESNVAGVYDVFEDGEFVESITESEAKGYK